MLPTPRLTVEESPDPRDMRYVEDALAAYNEAQVGDDHHQPVAVFLRTPDEAIVGGILGMTYWGWLNISILWIAEEWRGAGYGRRLLAAIETEALRRGCRHAHVDTMSFQALPFYLKHGYTVFGELQDLPPGHARYFLQKRLAQADDASSGGER